MKLRLAKPASKALAGAWLSLAITRHVLTDKGKGKGVEGVVWRLSPCAAYASKQLAKLCSSWQVKLQLDLN